MYELNTYDDDASWCKFGEESTFLVNIDQSINHSEFILLIHTIYSFNKNTQSGTVDNESRK